MLGPLLLSLATLASPGGSTNFRLVDGAVVVCSDSTLASEAPYDDAPIYDCADAQLPAVLDCDDAFTFALGEMIGSCESNVALRAPTRAALAASLLGDDRPVGKRLCVGDRCGVEKVPAVPSGPRSPQEAPVLLPLAAQLPLLSSIYLTIPYERRPTDGAVASLFRPPRA